MVYILYDDELQLKMRDSPRWQFEVATGSCSTLYILLFLNAKDKKTVYRNVEADVVE
jgi:hypothetical protein